MKEKRHRLDVTNFAEKAIPHLHSSIKVHTGLQVGLDRHPTQMKMLGTIIDGEFLELFCISCEGMGGIDMTVAAAGAW